MADVRLRRGRKSFCAEAGSPNEHWRQVHFYRPTLLEVCDPKMKIVQEEVFGTVLTMQVFDDVLSIAVKTLCRDYTNADWFGLRHASVQTALATQPAALLHNIIGWTFL